MDDKVMGALIGVGGVVLGLGLVSVKELVVHRAKRKRDAQYLAVRVVCILDAFVRSCVAVAEDDGEYDAEQMLHTTVDRPVLSFDGLQVEWKSIPVALTYAVLELPAKVDQAGHAVRVAAEISDPPDYPQFFQERQERHIELGLVCLDLGNQLRSLAGLSPDQSDSSQRLCDRREKLAEWERRRAAAHVSWESSAAEKPTPNALGDVT